MKEDKIKIARAYNKIPSTLRYFNGNWFSTENYGPLGYFTFPPSDPLKREGFTFEI